ncbi:DUF4041 domain-containing protein [Streptococcus dysgalactiae]|uniref:DUF4041 domain-containing protein n=1 Tax=Streptococcus dysgalactiae TaxID=1334 RepID=UPI0023DD7860|nr:DUF4041 domain-containing protein [Streptococcus dysgalactiae]WEQ85567.1 hypothetical protein MGCS35922_00136 [Streptococcus dysgalactiae subsp. equisimilis]
MGLFNFGKPKDEVLESRLSNLKSEIEIEKAKLNDLKRQLKIGDELVTIETQISKKKIELEDIKKDIAVSNDVLELQEFGFFERKYNFTDSTQYKNKLDSLRTQQKQLIKDGEAALIIIPMTLDGSQAKGKTMQKQLIKAMIRGFNGEVDGHLVKVSASNLEKKIASVKKSFEQLNKMYERNQIRLANNYLALKIDELRLAAEYELKKQEEKEILREQRAKEREDKKLQAEIAAKRKQVEKDRKHFSQMVNNVEKLLLTATDEEKIKLDAQLKEYQEKLAEIEEMEEDIDYREGHATAGYVYVISNLGAFGEDVYKIGVTRRLEPLDRIRELGSASVPFQFDVHALIFSENAFALEKELHDKFDKYKINKINSRKEYFKVPFSEIKSTLENHKELTIELAEEAEAFEYRQELLKGDMNV